MSSYWQKAKREAKKRAAISGYCWVWSKPWNGQKDYWKMPYLFYESHMKLTPPWVPKDAIRYGDGPYVEPEPTAQELFEDEIRREIRELKRLLPRF